MMTIGKRMLRAAAIGSALAVAVVGVVGAAPSPSRAATPAAVGVRGVVRQVTPSSAGGRGELLARLLVVGVRQPDTQVDRASVTVTRRTAVVRMRGGRRTPARFQDLALGQRVEVRFTGPVAESYPVQATASELLILEAQRP